MRRAIYGMALVSLVALGLGCAGSGPAKSELVGTWHATKVEYVSTTGLGSVDIMTLGAGFTLQLNEDNSAVLTFTRVGGHVDVMTGTWESSIDVLSFATSATSNWSWEMSLSATQLLLDGEGTSWDFNDDGKQEDASWHLVLTQ